MILDAEVTGVQINELISGFLSALTLTLLFEEENNGKLK